MKKAKIGELKNNLSRYLDHVRSGGSVLVLDRDQPVARLVPLGRTAARGASGSDDERLASLERHGLIRRGKGVRPSWLGKRRPARVKKSVMEELLTERWTGW